VVNAELSVDLDLTLGAYGGGSDLDEWHIDMMILLSVGRYEWFK
jgi:hypothetical protein